MGRKEEQNQHELRQIEQSFEVSRENEKLVPLLITNSPLGTTTTSPSWPRCTASATPTSSTFTGWWPPVTRKPKAPAVTQPTPWYQSTIRISWWRRTTSVTTRARRARCQVQIAIRWASSRSSRRAFIQPPALTRNPSRRRSSHRRIGVISFGRTRHSTHDHRRVFNCKQQICARKKG